MPFYKFCPLCGKKLVLKIIEGRKRASCSKCNFIHFGNPKTTASAIILKDKKILLTKRAFNPFKGKWDFPGGFIESGESIESGLKREILEELDVDIKIMKYLGSYSDKYYYHDFCKTLNFYFLAEVKKGKLKAQDDVKEIKFFELNKMPTPAFKNGQAALRDFLRAKNEKQT